MRRLFNSISVFVKVCRMRLFNSILVFVILLFDLMGIALVSYGVGVSTIDKVSEVSVYFVGLLILLTAIVPAIYVYGKEK